jgi:hypothetical protein
VIFGPFLIGGRLAGCWARFDVADRGGIIVLSGQQTVHMTSVSWAGDS